MTEMSFRCGPGRLGIVAAALVTGVFVISAGNPPALASPDEARAMTATKAARILARIRPRAENGVANAQYNLGVMYANGYGVEQSWDKARHWYRKAAKQNHAKAEQNLGVIYAQGKGVPVNKTKAAQWCLRAAHDGAIAAQNNLSVMYMRGTGIDKDIGQAAIWAVRAARGGNPQAEYNLSQIVARLPKRYIADGKVRMRSEPASETHIETLLDRGKRVARLASREHWTQVLLTDSRQVGWVKSSKLKIQLSATRLAQTQVSDSQQQGGPEEKHPEAAHDSATSEPDSGGRGHVVTGEAAQRVVAADSVNVHARPARSASVAFQVDSGAHITIKRAWKGWMLAMFPNGREGWIAGFLLN